MIWKQVCGNIHVSIEPIIRVFITWFLDAILYFDGMKADGVTAIPNCFHRNSTGELVLNSKLPLCTGGIFATYPQENLSLANGFLDQVQ